MESPTLFAFRSSLFVTVALPVIDGLAVQAYLRSDLSVISSLLGLSAAVAGCGSALLWSRADLDRTDAASNMGAPALAGVTAILTGAASMIASTTAPSWAYLYAAFFCLLGFGLAVLTTTRAYSRPPASEVSKSSSQTTLPPDRPVSTSADPTPGWAYGCAAVVGLLALALAVRTAKRAAGARSGPATPSAPTTADADFDVRRPDTVSGTDATAGRRMPPSS